MKHILVVEDEPLNAIVFRKVLEKRGSYRVTVTEQADVVLQLARSGAIDLVIMDVSLAHTRWEGRPVNGVELCRILKNDARTARIPVLLATAYAMRGDAESLIAQSGADHYVSKPILDHEQFVTQVRGLLAEAA